MYPDIARAFESQTYIANRIDVQQTPLYDTVTTAASAALTTGTQFFVNVGQNSGKTYNQTNMTKSGQLPSPQAFSVMAMRLYFKPNILRADLLALYDAFALELWLGDKQYQRAPLWHYTAGAGIDGFSTVNADSAYTNGVPSREAMNSLAIPIVIENGMNFYAQIVGTASITATAAASGGTGITMVCVLDGFYARGVQ